MKPPELPLRRQLIRDKKSSNLKVRSLHVVSEGAIPFQATGVSGKPDRVLLASTRALLKKRVLVFINGRQRHSRVGERRQCAGAGLFRAARWMVASR